MLHSLLLAGRSGARPHGPELPDFQNIRVGVSLQEAAGSGLCLVSLGSIFFFFFFFYRLSTLVAGSFFVWGHPGHCGMLSSTPGPHPLNARSTPSHDDHRYPQT